jgi:hypothetical protein
MTSVLSRNRQGAHGLLQAQAREWYCGAPKGVLPAAARMEDDNESAALEPFAVAAAAQAADGRLTETSLTWTKRFPS